MDNKGVTTSSAGVLTAGGRNTKGNIKKQE
jgi:hypothetical protein